MNILGICGGNGVILYPMRKKLIANIEPRTLFHTKGDKQWKANFGDIPMFRSFESYAKDNRFKGKSVDIIVGAPDCGHSSMLSYSRKKTLSNPFTNDSLMLYINSISYFQPMFFLMENLPKLLDTFTPTLWKELFPEYYFFFHNGPVSMFGNSQFSRVRTIIIGINKNKAKQVIEEAQYHFNHIYKINEPTNCKNLLRGLKDENINIGHVREDINSTITIYAGRKLTLKQAQKYWNVFKDEKHWVVKNRNFKTAPGVYRNLDHEAPLVARKANRQFNHQGLQMTPRELARIQGIPDKFKIYMEPENIGYFINKGRTTVTKTPPYEIGKWFYKQIKKLKL